MTRRRLTLVASPAILAVLLVALLLPAPAVAQTTQVVEYYHTDVLGSVRAVTNQQGQVIRRHDFRPFGEELQATVPPPDKPLFTGKERDAETGLDYFGARYQRAGVGRFTSVDPLMTIDENLVDPQRWNRYAYARTNPLRWVDPDGRMVFLAIPLIWQVGTAIVAAGSIYVSTPQGQQQVRAVVEGTGQLITKAVDRIRTWVSNEDSAAKAKSEKSPAPATAPKTKDFESPDSIPGGWEWRGQGQPGSREGAYHNPKTKESMHDDRSHPDGRAPHWTYTDPKGVRWDNFGNGWVRQK